MGEDARVSFCISTYKRPEFLRKQLASLSEQVFTDFEIVISDNDPDASARDVVGSFDDPRFRYFSNKENLGMIKSFNKSIERAGTEFIVMVTDDDPVEKDFLSTVFGLIERYPGHSFYGGITRTRTLKNEVECIKPAAFLGEFLDKSKSSYILWSSCIIRRSVALEIGCIPDYGSPHLADEAFLVKAGMRDGAVIINRLFSVMSSHDGNYSKFNFEAYLAGCKGFYEDMKAFFKDSPVKDADNIIVHHLGAWMISSIFNLKRYYTIHNYTPATLRAIENCAYEMLGLPYMNRFKLRFQVKNVIFSLKRRLNLLK